MESTKARIAARVEPSDHSTLMNKVPPRLRSSCSKRRCATNDTMEGAISTATTSTQTMTMMGMASMSTSSGASITGRLSTPKWCSQPHNSWSQLAPSSWACVQATAAAQ